MSKRHAVAAPPVNIASIDDPQLQSALKPLFDAWNVRNGYAGEGDQQFITKADIIDLVKSDIELRGAIIDAVVPGGDGGGGGSDTPAKDAINYLSGLIFNDPLWIELGTKIEGITFNINGVKSDLNVQKSLIQGNSSTINGLQTSVFSRTSETDAILQAIKNQFSAIVTDGGWVTDPVTGETTWRASTINFGAIYDNQTTWANAFASLAEKTTKVEARLDGCVDSQGNVIPCDDEKRVTIEQHFEAIADLEDGLSGEYTLKIDANGFVAGFGLAVDDEPDESGVRSRMYIRADRFAIGHPSTGKSDLDTPGGDADNAVIPFIVQDGKVYINHALVARAEIDWAQIVHADIDSAYIKDLTVDKLTGGVGKFYRIYAANHSISQLVPGAAPFAAGSGWTTIYNRTFYPEKVYTKTADDDGVITTTEVPLKRTQTFMAVANFITKTDESIFVRARWVNTQTGNYQETGHMHQGSGNSTRVQVAVTRTFDLDVPNTHPFQLLIVAATQKGKQTTLDNLEGSTQTIYSN